MPIIRPVLSISQVSRHRTCNILLTWKPQFALGLLSFENAGKYMIFSLLTFASAFLIEALGTWISIIGLSSLFSADPIIIALAAALDVGKVVTVSFLYKRWSTAPRMLMMYMILATAVLMVITSAGAFGYLSAAFQGAIKDTKQQQILVTASVEEKAKLEARKREIDVQIANLPAHIVSGRQKLIAAFKSEADRINVRLRQLDAELPKMRAQQITINTHAGPIVYVAQAFDVSVEQAIKYVILVIIFVFDPLAIALLVAGNFLWETRETRVREQRLPAEAFVPPYQPVPQESRVDLAEATPDPAPAETADPVGVARDEAAAESAGLDAEWAPPPIQPAPAQSPSEQPAVQASESSSAAKVDADLAEVTMEIVAIEIPADEQVPGNRNLEQAIREKAYYIAEQRAFKGGAPADDWVLAEKEIDNKPHAV